MAIAVRQPMRRPLQLLSLVALLAAACANGVEDPGQTASETEKGDSGTQSVQQVPAQELCGNGLDDNGNGLVDENCDCPDSGTNTEIQNNCNPTCVPENTHEERCSDGKDDDCDGKIDCDDSDCRKAGACGCEVSETSCSDGQDNDCNGLTDCDDPACRHPGECGCTASETTCGDGKDDDCDGKTDCEDSDCQGCTPGTTRYCADPNFCALGQQTCTPARQWGPCSETLALGCYGEGLDGTYQCCIQNGGCCQDQNGHSAGNCGGIDDCNLATSG